MTYIGFTVIWLGICIVLAASEIKHGLKAIAEAIKEDK